ncbi:MAG TPA: asparagine synthase (glutamine-hydrolyzing) [Holophagaceae bacterium]|nr:asparagine synthase (glutamine-hydrolyzing) [Holophagaceae bacterium]
MCGIVGMIMKGGAFPEPVLRGMTRTIAHRGPDGEGIHVEGPVGLGHRRLSIIDPAGGHQPMCNEDGSVWITFNGEIYNYKELMADLQGRGHQFKTRSDTEVVVHAWEEWGDACVDRFRGMFAFGIRDTREGCVFLARDHFGIKPLVICETEEAFSFSSEIAPLVQTPGFDSALDLQAIDQYLWLQYVPAPRTAYRQIRKLPPAHRMRVGFDGQPETSRRYWAMRFEPEEGLSVGEWEERLAGVVKESVNAHLVSDVPFGAFLSGGVDSSLVVAEMSTILTEPVRTFSIGFQEAEFDETSYAAFAAQTCGTIHTRGEMGIEALDLIPDLVRHYGEPFGDSSALPTWHVCKLARASVPMVLSGDGADEMFAGYWSHGNWMEKPSTDLYAWIDKIQYTETRMRAGLWRPEFHSGLSTRLHGFERFWDETLYYTDLNRVQYMDLNTYLPYDILPKVDIASMMHGLEVRTPFVDLRVMEAAAKVPSRHSMIKAADGSWNRKAMLKRVARRFFPESFLVRPKMGFAMPMTKWLAPGGKAFEHVSRKLLGPDSCLGPYFNPEVIQALLDNSRTPTLWLLLILEEWLQQHKTLPMSGGTAPHHLLLPAPPTDEEGPAALAFSLKAAMDRRDWPVVRKGMRHLLATWPSSPEARTASRWLAENPADPGTAPAAPARRPKVLFIADVPNWIFERHARTLRTRLADEFDIDIAYKGDPVDEDRYDLIHPLEWHMAEPAMIHTPTKWVSGLRSHVSWEGLDVRALSAHLARLYQGGIYAVSRRLLDIFRPGLPGIVGLPHGVDTTFFTARKPREGRKGKLRVGWAGNRASAVKGFATFIEPLGKLPGVELVFCGYSDRLLTLEEMRDFYEDIDVYVCTSATEGHNNSLMEAASMGRAIVTTDVGTVPEYLQHEASALIVPREAAAVRAAILRLRDDLNLRAHLGLRARESVIEHFDWSRREQDYRRFFREALATARRAAEPHEGPIAPEAREAFLHEPDWSGSGWAEVLMAYLEAFKPTDPVDLILPIHPGSPGALDLATAQSHILELVVAAGLESFPNVILLDSPGEVLETLRRSTHLQWVNAPGTGGPEPTGPLGLRFARALQSLAGKGTQA